MQCTAVFRRSPFFSLVARPFLFLSFNVFISNQIKCSTQLRLVPRKKTIIICKS
jgi:hypothetical protein